MAAIREAMAPLVVKTITEQLAQEHRVLDGASERKEVRYFLCFFNINDSYIAGFQIGWQCYGTCVLKLGKVMGHFVPDKFKQWDILSRTICFNGTFCLLLEMLIFHLSQNNKMIRVIKTNFNSWLKQD